MKQIYIVFQIDDDGDLMKYVFEHLEEAQQHLNENENQAYLIGFDGECYIKDYT